MFELGAALLLRELAKSVSVSLDTVVVFSLIEITL